MPEADNHPPVFVQLLGDRYLWNVNRKRGMLNLGSTPPDVASAEVSDFESLTDFFTSDTVQAAYREDVIRQMRRKGFYPPRDERLTSLSVVINRSVRKHILGDKKSPEESSLQVQRLDMVSRNLDLVFSSLRNRELHSPNRNKNPFVKDLTKGVKIEVDLNGQKEEMEAIATCPAVRLVHQLYWDFEKIIVAPVSEEAS